MVSKNAYMGKAAPSDVESFQSFPWLLPDFTILFIHYVHNISQCFSEKQNQLDMCVCIYTYIVRNWHTPSWKLNSDLQSCSLSQDPSRKDRLLSLETGRKRQSFLTQPVFLGMPTTDWARAIHPGEASVLNSVC